MDIKFKVNPIYVFLHALNMAQKEEPFLGWADFTNEIWEKDPGIFYYLAGSPEYVLYANLDQISALTIKAKEVLSKIQKSVEYQRLIAEAEEYSMVVEKQWEKNKNIVSRFIEDFSGLTLPSTEIQVYITHPKLKNGFTIDSNKIAWGHPEEYTNYTTVFIAHELMHILTNHDNSDIAHAVIELLIDNELRIKLNNQGIYFEYSGHSYLKNIEQKILPKWKNYLRQTEKNIIRFIDEIKKEV